LVNRRTRTSDFEFLKCSQTARALDRDYFQITPCIPRQLMYHVAERNVSTKRFDVTNGGYD
jgi:hypothetical protein